MRKSKKPTMKLIIVGDESKARENLTRILFDITMEQIKNGDIKNLDYNINQKNY